MTERALDRIAGMPGVTSATAAVPRLGWPAEGVRILSPSGDCGVICFGQPMNLKGTRFTSYTYTDFHYCPSAKWEDWVELAKRILAIDAAFDAENSATITDCPIITP